MVYNSVKYVQIGKKIGHLMVFLLVPISSLWRDPQPHVLLWHCWYLVVHSIRVKGICWDCKWFPISSTTTGHTQKHKTKNGNYGLSPRRAHQSGSKGWRAPVMAGLDFTPAVDSFSGWWSCTELKRRRNVRISFGLLGPFWLNRRLFPLFWLLHRHNSVTMRICVIMLWWRLFPSNLKTNPPCVISQVKG